MDLPSPAPAFCLHHAGVLLPNGVSRSPLACRDGRVADVPSMHDYRIDLRDHLVLPALINAHEHLHVNAVPPLPDHAPFANSYAWMAAFQPHFDTPAVKAALRVPKALRMRHGALKNLLAGTTCVAHHDPWHPVMDAPDFPVALLRNYGWSYAPGWPGYGPPLLESFRATPADRPWMIHLAEGTDDVARAELQALDALGCLGANSVLVHGVGLRDEDIQRVLAARASVVWCPSSNLTLLGATLDPHRLAAAGLLALGSDSRLSGARDLLAEMQGVIARGEFDALSALALATADAARVLRFSDRGHLQPGAHADLLIVEDRGGVSSSLAGLHRSDIRAVVRDGVPRVADMDFAEWFAAMGVEAVRVWLDGRPKLLAANLAEPSLVALEPGLDRAFLPGVRDLTVMAGAHC